jgi:Zn-dependent protease
MKWSWKLGRFKGIDAYVHASFLLLLAWAAWAAFQGAGSGLAALLGVVFLIGVFGSVLLHEFGHALTARHYGIRTRRIVLWPIGGIAQLEGQPRSPKQELHIALAGPAVNFILAAGLWGLISIAGLPSYGLLGSLMVANLTLGLFNLVPAFPMDGGRILRAFLATRMGGGRATDLAVKIGKGAAVAFVIAGLFGNPMLMLVGAFVWFAAGAEGRRIPYGHGAGPSDPRLSAERLIVFIRRR